MRWCILIVLLLLTGILAAGVSADTRFVFHSQGFLTPRQIQPVSDLALQTRPRTSRAAGIRSLIPYQARNANPS